MSKSNTFENDLLLLIFNATAIADIAENDSSSPLTNLYVALHTADPGEGGAQNASECSYTGYARVAVARSGSGWTVTGNSVSPAAAITFPQNTGSGQTATWFSVGTASSGANKILYRGEITTPSGGIVVGNLVTPELTTSTTITED